MVMIYRKVGDTRLSARKRKEPLIRTSSLRILPTMTILQGPIILIIMKMASDGWSMHHVGCFRFKCTGRNSLGISEKTITVHITGRIIAMHWLILKDF